MKIGLILIFILFINITQQQGLSSKDKILETVITSNLSHGDSFDIQGLNNGIFGNIYGNGDSGKIGVEFRKFGEIEKQYEIGENIIQNETLIKPTLCEIDVQGGQETFLSLYLVKDPADNFIRIKGNIINVNESSNATIEFVAATDPSDILFGQTCTKIPGNRAIIMWYQKTVDPAKNVGLMYKIFDIVTRNQSIETLITESEIKQQAQIKLVDQNDTTGISKIIVMFYLYKDTSLPEVNLCLSLIEFEYDTSDSNVLTLKQQDDNCIQGSGVNKDDYLEDPSYELSAQLKHAIITQDSSQVIYAVILKKQSHHIGIVTYDINGSITCYYNFYSPGQRLYFKQSDLSINENKVYIVIYGIKGIGSDQNQYVIFGQVQDVSTCASAENIIPLSYEEDEFMQNTGQSKIEALQVALTSGDNNCSLIMGINYSLEQQLNHLNYLIFQDRASLDIRCSYGCQSECYQCIGSTLENKELRDINITVPSICLCKEGYYDDPTKFLDDYTGDIDCHRCNYKCTKCETTENNCSACNGDKRDPTNFCECLQYHFFDETNIQYTDAPTNTIIDYTQDYNCLPCLEECETCSSSTQCDTCKDNKRDILKECIGCLDGYGLFQGECVLCDGEDKELITLDGEIYQSCVCRQKYFLDGELFVNSDGENDFTCTACLEQCSSCKDLTGCAECQDTTRQLPECLICDSPNYYSYKDVCIECTGLEQISNGELIPSCICNDTFFIEDNGTNDNFTCENCQDTCSTCVEIDTCSTCPNDRHSPADSCTQCDYSLYARSINDDLNCITCDGEGVIKDGENICICDDLYFQDSVISVYDDNFYCKSCSILCASCEKVSGDCISCAQVNRSPPDCVCSLQFYLDENQICQRCDSYCDNCVDKADNCTGCQGAFRETPDCNCPVGYLPNENKQEDCVKCPLNCNKCDSTGLCIEFQICDPPSRIPPLCLEVVPPTCLPGQYLDTVGVEVYECKACLPTCGTCTQPEKCDLCKPTQAGVNIYEECYKQGLQYNQLTCDCIEITDSKEVACPGYCSNCLTIDNGGHQCGTCQNPKYQEPLCVCLVGQYWDDKTRLCTNCYTGCNTCTGGSKNCDDKIIIINPDNGDITINNNTGEPKEEESYLWLYILVASILILLLFAIFLVVYFKRKRQKQKIHNKFLEGKHQHEKVNNPQHIPTLMIESIDNQPAFDFDMLKTNQNNEGAFTQEAGAGTGIGAGGIALATGNSQDAARNKILANNRELLKQQEDLRRIQQMEEEEEEYYGEDSAYNKSQNQLNDLRKNEQNYDKQNSIYNKPYGIDKNFQNKIKNAGNGTGQAWNHQNISNNDETQDYNNLDNQNPNDISGLSNLPHQNNMDISLNEQNINDITGNQQLLQNSSNKKPPHPTSSSYYINSGLKSGQHGNNFNDNQSVTNQSIGSGNNSYRKTLKDRKNARKQKDVQKYQKNQIISSSRLSGRDINSSGTLEMNNPLINNKKNSLHRNNSNNSINFDKNISTEGDRNDNDENNKNKIDYNEINKKNDELNNAKNQQESEEYKPKKVKKMVKKFRPNGTFFYEEEEIELQFHKKGRNFNPSNKVFSRKEQQKIEEAKKDLQKPTIAFEPLSRKLQKQGTIEKTIDNKQQNSEIKQIINSNKNNNDDNGNNNKQNQEKNGIKDETQPTNSNSNNSIIDKKNNEIEDISDIDINDDELNDIEIDFAAEKQKAIQSAQKKLQSQQKSDNKNNKSDTKSEIDNYNNRSNKKIDNSNNKSDKKVDKQLRKQNSNSGKKLDINNNNNNKNNDVNDFDNIVEKDANYFDDFDADGGQQKIDDYNLRNSSKKKLQVQNDGVDNKRGYLNQNQGKSQQKTKLKNKTKDTGNKDDVQKKQNNNQMKKDMELINQLDFI